MRKSKFSEAQIVAMLREGEAGVPVVELLRKYGVSRPAYYLWKQKYGVAGVPELQRLKQLEQENGQLKRMYAELALENTAIKDVLHRKRYRRLPDEPLPTHQLSIVRACDVVRRSRTAYYRSTEDLPERDAPVVAALLALIAEKTRRGFWTCWKRLCAMGHAWNHKRVCRVYCALRLNQVRRTKKRVLTRVRVPMDATAVLIET